MALVGVSIRKSVLFRGVQQDFHNVYYYQGAVPSIGTLLWNAIIDDIVTKEKLWHSTDVTFKYAQLWTAGGTRAENDMKVQRTLSGTGSGTPYQYMDRERAILIRWPAGKDRLGRPVYFRKYYHICGNWQSIGWSAGHMQNTLAIDDTSRNTIATAANGLKVTGGTVDTYTLCGPTGRSITGDAQCHKWVEHHQLGDEWR